MGKLAPHLSCGDEIPSCRGFSLFVATRSSSCRRHVQVGKLAPTWENSHPHGKTCAHLSCGDKIFIVSGKCKLKTRTHMGKLAAHLSCGDEISSCRRHVQVGKLAPTWENSHPHGKTRAHMGKLAAHFCDGSERTRFQKADQTAGKSCRNGCVSCKSRGEWSGYSQGGSLVNVLGISSSATAKAVA